MLNPPQVANFGPPAFAASLPLFEQLRRFKAATLASAELAARRAEEWRLRDSFIGEPSACNYAAAKLDAPDRGEQ